jgi:hypothetical protein
VNTLPKKTLRGRDHVVYLAVVRRIILKFMLINRSIGCRGVDSIQLVHNRVGGWGVANTIVNLQVPRN